MTTNIQAREAVGEYKWGFHDEEQPLFIAEKGLNEDVIRGMSKMKGEPEWMLEQRLEALATFRQLHDPTWAGSPELLQAIDFDNIHYYVRATDRDATKWEDVPEYIKDTFDKLGIPEAERQFLAGAGAQYDSEVVYHNIREDLKKQGVVFLGMDQGLAEHEDLVREYFGTVVPAGDNRYAALNSAVWSGGSFIYVPPGVHVD
nr:Fe-S cluster assembly protein SufB [Dehalococcoidia bacterium]